MPGAPATEACGPGDVVGRERMPRISGDFAWPSRIAAQSGWTNETWPTTTEGRPNCAFMVPNHSVSATCSSIARAAWMCTLPTTLKPLSAAT